MPITDGSTPPHVERGRVVWLVESLLPLWQPTWMVAWSLATFAAVLIMRHDGIGVRRPVLSLLLTVEVMSWGALLATAGGMVLRSLRHGIGKLAPGAWLCLVSAGSTSILVLLFYKAGVAPRTPAYVWHAAVSSTLFLCPLYLVRLPLEWRQRFIGVVVVQLIPLVLRLLFIALPLDRNGAEALLMRTFWIPDVVSAALMLFGVRRISRQFADDPWHRAGVVLYAIHSVTFAVTVGMAPTWLL
ncbi:MAG: hypothetical protein O2931_01295 [Planctomycetota bacterium]|nr:hypothetical protein [Planctomycetota bacterium]MDA1177408.1 hypothetical protein [Planctomycetota bacterium]